MDAKYEAKLSIRDTQRAINKLFHFIEKELCGALSLERVVSPIATPSGTGINDDLDGIKQPARFFVKEGYMTCEIIHALSKWKRMALADYGYKEGEGIITDMHGLRPDYKLDATHCVSVDQWDWEVVINDQQRRLDYLKEVVRKIYDVIKRAQLYIMKEYPVLNSDKSTLWSSLPDQITFIHSEDLLAEFPSLDQKSREKEVVKKYGAVFIIGIGAKLENGKPHEARAPDYDDWITPTSDGKRGLNGDILVWNPEQNETLELSSMGIRVNKQTLMEQLKEQGKEKWKDLYFHKRILSGELPLSIGGGIGQSRVYMLLLKKKSVSEVIPTMWPKEVLQEFKEQNIPVL